jgi:hypothetical protein
MEADWEVEIGVETPVIDALWPGFIDLRRNPERIIEIEEARRFPQLAEALLQLNSVASNDSAESGSRIWTAKCDLWTVEEWNPDEMDASSAESKSGLACYIDMLPRQGLVFSKLDEAEQWARVAVSSLRKATCRCSRADLVIRRAFAGDREGMGITTYVTACGADSEAARKALAAALLVFCEECFSQKPALIQY